MTHATAVLSRVADGVTVTDTSRDGWFGLALTGTLRPRHERRRGLRRAAGAGDGPRRGRRRHRGPARLRRVGLLVTDVDSTLITAEVIELLAEHAGTREEVAAVTERAMRGELDFAASLRERVATLAGLDTGVLEEVRARVSLTPGARELVAAVHDAGGSVGVVSGGFAEVVEPLAASLGIEHVVANRLEVEDGRFTGRTTGPVVDRAAKERHLRAWAEADGVTLGRVVAVGDGANDLDMLGAAGLGVAFCAKPVVQRQAHAAVGFPRLDAVLGLLGR
ncbi:phosphoserine phosphatase SerB [Georgenia sp. SUBG003]|uniref:phosphoserine phosphatase SerB n=1 Tax=Georgenia sp. SUBG003 TaxID=1497974 RepID=UPI000AB5DF40